MANILYGVSGEGSGHSSRSKEILSHLSKKHKVHVITYGKAYPYLEKYFPTTKIYGLHLSFKDNKIEYVKTFMNNLNNFVSSFEDFKNLRKLLKNFKPDLIITDFEPTSVILSNLYNVPLISIDNQHRITNLKIEVPDKYKKEFFVCKSVIKAIVPDANYYLATSFFKEKLNDKKTFIAEPIIREDVMKLIPSNKGHVLVYQTSKSNKKVLKELKSVDQKFIIYGFDVSKKDKNLIFKKFSTSGFLNDLASCKAVITNGGFTLMTEALYLKKPVLSEPIQGQFEQILNAYYLNKMGYGEFVEKMSGLEIKKFLNNIPIYERELENYTSKDNKKIFKKLDKIVKKLIKKKFRWLWKK